MPLKLIKSCYDIGWTLYIDYILMCNRTHKSLKNKQCDKGLFPDLIKIYGWFTKSIPIEEICFSSFRRIQWDKAEEQLSHLQNNKVAQLTDN